MEHRRTIACIVTLLCCLACVIAYRNAREAVSSLHAPVRIGLSKISPRLRCGRCVVAFLSSACLHCQVQVPNLVRIAEAPSSPLPLFVVIDRDGPDGIGSDRLKSQFSRSLGTVLVSSETRRRAGIEHVPAVALVEGETAVGLIYGERDGAWLEQTMRRFVETGWTPAGI